MDVQFWFMLVGATGAAIATVWWLRRPRRVFNIDHIRVELHDAHIVDDRVVDAVWRAALSMTNKSRRPRLLPVFAERATVGAGFRAYLAIVYLESEVSEIDPGDVALAWIEFVLPAGVRPCLARVVHLGEHRPARMVRIPQTAAPADMTIRMSVR